VGGSEAKAQGNLRAREMSTWETPHRGGVESVRLEISRVVVLAGKRLRIQKE
jgi:hypothetical protein